MRYPPDLSNLQSTGQINNLTCHLNKKLSNRKNLHVRDVLLLHGSRKFRNFTTENSMGRPTRGLKIIKKKKTRITMNGPRIIINNYMINYMVNYMAIIC